MELPNLTMSRQNAMDALVERIKRSISKERVCRLRRDELSIIWYGNAKLIDEQRRIYIRNFAMLHGLFVVIHYRLEHAIFC